MSEMKRLESALARARSGQAAVVALIAEAGAGKSRLAAEFADTCRRGGLAVFEAHAPAHGRRIPNLAAADFYRSLFGIAAADSARAAREKIAGRLVLLDETMREHLPLVFELLGVGEADAEPTPKDAEVREQRLLGVARRVLDDASRSEPAVVLWEDLHWLDEASESFLRAFVESARAARTLVILTFRPEYPAGWLEECGAEILRLAPLGDSAVGELLGDLLGGPAASAGLIQRVRERTGGNPFFIEEVVQSLFERGVLDRANGEVRVKLPVAEVDIPSSVRAVLAARIDRLPENRRRVLQTAAVIGKRFARSVLREVLPAPESDLQPILDDLVAAEFLFAGGTESDPEYVFKHPLTQEVADQSQLVEHRTRVHAAVAGAMQSIYAERADEHAALIAYHWEGAAEPLAAAAWLQRAAETAGVMGPRAELPHWRHIRELLADRDDREALRTRVLAIARMIILGTRIAEATEDVASLLAEGQEIAERLGEDAPKGGLLAARAIFYGVRGERDEALRAIGEALRIADADDTPLFTAEVAAMAVNVYDWFGFYREMQNVSERALARLETGEPGTASSLYPYLLVAKGLALSMSGRLAEGAHVLERALELARKSRDPETIGRAHLELAFNALDACDPPTALRHVTAAREIGERLGSGSVYGPAFVALGATLAASERWEEAVATLSAVREVLRQARSGRTFEGIILSYLAQAHLGHGDQAAALDIAEEAVRCTQRDGVIGYELRAQLDLAQTLRACAGAAAADRIGAAIDRAAALMAESGAFVHRAAIEVERAELARLLGDDAAYESGLRSARRLFTEMGAFGHAARLAERLGDSA
jgi:adenylate cyclase